MARPAPAGSFGANAGLVDEMYDQYRADPSSVSASWRDFFDDYRPDGVRNGRPSRAPPSSTPPQAPPRPPPPRRPAPHAARRLRPRRPRSDGCPRRRRPASGPCGGRRPASRPTWRPAWRVPTATSTRVVPARLLEVNRKVINGHLARIGSTKVSFTHLIGYAVVRALDAVPAMKSTYADTDAGPPSSATTTSAWAWPSTSPKPDGTRTLLVPCINDADTLDFAAFHAAYEDLIRRIRANRIDARRLRRRHHDPHQPGHARHGLLGAPAHARPERDRRRRRPRLPGRVRGRRPAGPGPAGHLQDGHPVLHLRPPGHPGGGVGAVPGPGPRAAVRRRRVLRRRLPVARRPLRGGAVAARRQPARRPRRPARSSRSTSRP